MTLTTKDLATFCKKKGFVYQSSEIYGGMAGFWDYGPLGVELFNNLKSSWWKQFVKDKQNMVGLDASIICHPQVWKASGHLDNFGDLVLTCTKCKNKLRADHYIEDQIDINVEGQSIEEINKLIEKHNLKCPKCKSGFEELKDFNLLFETSTGADETKKSTAYLRGETAQGMFTNFKIVTETTRQKLPFGIAQIGKCFRNEISPRDFMFRGREFTIAEFEFFIHPNEKKCNLLTKEHKELKLMLLDAETQDKEKNDLKETTISDILKSKKLGEWHAYWLAEQVMWLYSVGLRKENLKIREHTKTELSHYSSATFDLDYKYPFGSKELAGNANRGQYDLNQHIKESKQKLGYFDEESKERVVPRVIEPTFGMDRVFLAVMVEAYCDDKKRGNVVLKLPKRLAPTYCAIFPLVKKDEKLVKKACEIFDELKTCYPCFYDESGSVGRRYARADEIGVPFCITVDSDSLEDGTVTIRDRDTTNQERVKISELREKLFSLYLD